MKFSTTKIKSSHFQIALSSAEPEVKEKMSVILR